MKVQCVELDERGQNARPLLTNGLFAVETASQLNIREFGSEESARAAGERAANRRPGSTLIFPGASKPVGRDRHQLEHPGMRA